MKRYHRLQAFEILRHAALMPLMAPTNCQYDSGLYGFPKFKQLVIADGTPPEQVRYFCAASETAIDVPSSGSACTYLELQSTVIANALLVPLMFTTPASEGCVGCSY
jgi:hypothetical protein